MSGVAVFKLGTSVLIQSPEPLHLARSLYFWLNMHIVAIKETFIIDNLSLMKGEFQSYEVLSEGFLHF